MIDYKKLTIEYAFENPWWKHLQREDYEPVLYNTYQDIPVEDRFEDEHEHMVTGGKEGIGIIGMRDCKKIGASMNDHRYMSNRTIFKYEFIFEAACKAIVAISTDEELTKAYEYWLKFSKESIERHLTREKELFLELTSDENLEKNYQEYRAKYHREEKK